MPIKEKQIILFTRYPAPGKNKTRLIPALGPAGAADFHRQMVENTLDKIQGFARQHPAGFEIFLDGGTREGILRWLGKDVPVGFQPSGDLGRRMGDAFRKAFNQGAKQVVLVGADVPGLSEDRFQKAFEALSSQDVVIGPSTDGGYWLLGMRQYQDIFSTISWGGPEVLSQTLKRGGDHGLSFHLLDPLRDVDTPEDLMAVLPRGVFGKPYVTVIIPALNEEEHIERAIQSAGCEDAEILVVDGGSQDATVKKALNAGAVVVKAFRGRAVQQNAGAGQAKGKVFLFLHADTLLPPGYVTSMFNLLLDREMILGAFRFKTTLNTPFMRFMEKVVHFRSTVLQMPYGDQGLFLKKKTFHRLGGFPVTPIAEDMLLVKQAAKHGRIRIAPVPAMTSGRRWARGGMLRTFLINQVVVLGFCAGVSPEKLAALYRRG